MTGESLVSVADVMDRLWRLGAWESQQTHESLLKYLLEESYELIDAVRSGDTAHIREELGDLLLQVLFHARIAEAAGEFTVDDVAAGLESKLRHRSPHLDAGHEVTVAEQEAAWESRKASEKTRDSILDGIAWELPALALAEKVVERCEAAGIDVPPELVGLPSELEVRARIIEFAERVRMSESVSSPNE